MSISAGQDEGDYELAGHTVFVVPNAQMSDTVLESRIREVVEKSLLNQGYVLAPPAHADLYVMASFGAMDRFALSSISLLAPATTRTETTSSGATLRKVYPEHMEHPEILSLRYFGKSSGGLKSVDISEKEVRHWQTAR